MFGRSCLLNELELFPEKQSVDTSSTMTTKELAEALNVTPQTIRDAVERLGLAKSILQVKIRGQNSYAFTEAQATAIKLELQNHSKVNSLSPKTALEKQLIIRQAMQIQQEIIDELQAENNKQSPYAHKEDLHGIRNSQGTGNLQCKEAKPYS